MRIDMWMDTACPWCYLGLRHLRAALSAFPHAGQVEVVLRAHVHRWDGVLEGVVAAHGGTRIDQDAPEGDESATDE